MNIGSISNKVYKFVYIYFILLFAVVTYIFITKEDIKSDFQQNILTDLKQKYLTYKKVYLISPNIKSILIKNENFIDKSDLIEQFTKSTPLMIEKEEKKINRYDITYAFFSINESYSKEINSKIETLKTKEYFIETKDKNISLFGKVFDDGYIYITKYMNEDKNLSKSIDILFYELSIFALINIIVFIYFMGLIKNNKQVATRLVYEFEQLKDDTEKMAFEDTLTGAATRLKFDQTLKDLIQIASRFEQNKFSVIMFDIDNFKIINDNHGHDFGDFILKSVSNIVRNNIRGSDTFARWGGEEFVILSPMSSLEQAINIAEKLRVEISSTTFSQGLKVTCSFGVVCFEERDNEEKIIKRVDKLLYKAKKTGKNKVET